MNQTNSRKRVALIIGGALVMLGMLLFIIFCVLYGAGFFELFKHASLESGTITVQTEANTSLKKISIAEINEIAPISEEEFATEGWKNPYDCKDDPDVVNIEACEDYEPMYYEYRDGVSEVLVQDENEAIDWILRYRNILGIAPMPLELEVKTGDNQQNKQYNISQYHLGVPVRGTAATIITNQSGHVTEFAGQFADVSRIDTTPKLTAEKAAKGFLSKDVWRNITEAELIICHGLGDDRYRLAWSFSAPGANLDVIVDANTGEILWQSPKMIN